MRWSLSEIVYREDWRDSGWALEGQKAGSMDQSMTGREGDVERAERGW